MYKRVRTMIGAFFDRTVQCRPGSRKFTNKKRESEPLGHTKIRRTAKQETAEEIQSLPLWVSQRAPQKEVPQKAPGDSTKAPRDSTKGPKRFSKRSQEILYVFFVFFYVKDVLRKKIFT